jgi:hypothetical protein
VQSFLQSLGKFVECLICSEHWYISYFNTSNFFIFSTFSWRATANIQFESEELGLGYWWDFCTECIAQCVGFALCKDSSLVWKRSG